MKKFVVFFLLCSFLFCSSLFGKEFDFSQFNNLQVQVFTNSKCDKKIDGVSYVENGQGQILICDYDCYKNVIKSYENISGVTFVFDGDKHEFGRVMNQLGVKLIKKDETSFIGFSNNFSSSVEIEGKKVNVQGYLSDRKIYIGTPLLLGSY